MVIFTKFHHFWWKSAFTQKWPFPQQVVEFGENHSLGSRGHLKSINSALLFLVQITASRTVPRKVLKSPAIHPRAPTCIRVRDLGRLFEISRIQFRCSRSTPLAQEVPFPDLPPNGSSCASELLLLQRNQFRIISKSRKLIGLLLSFAPLWPQVGPEG